MQKLSFVGRYFRDVALLHQRCLKTMEHDVVNKLKPCGCHIRWCYVYVCNHRWLMAILLFARLTWGRLHMGGGPTWLFDLCWREFVWSASSVRFVELFFVLSDREHPKRFVRVEPTSYRQHCEPVEPTLCQQQPHAALIYLTANGCHRLVHSLPFLLPGFGGLAETGLHREGHGGTGSLPGPAE